MLERERLPWLGRTSEDVPSAAPEFNITAVTATSLTITWQPLPPCERNGVITNYTIAYRMEGGMDMSFSEVAVGDTRLMHVVKSLTPYTNYTIKMAATTSVGRGELGPEVTVQTDESTPSEPQNFTVEFGDFSMDQTATTDEDVPSAAPEFNIKSVTATSITITWHPLPPVSYTHLTLPTKA